MIHMTKIAAAAVVCAAASVALSFAHPFGDPHGQSSEAAGLFSGAQTPPDVRATFERKCVNCHSESVEWPFYSHMAPVSWMLEHDVVEAREHLNMSLWQRYTPEQKSDLLGRIAAETRAGEMPPARYTMIHRDAKLTPDDQQRLYLWAKAERKRLMAEAVR